MKEPKIQVGISSEPQIEFILLNSYHIKGKETADRQAVTHADGQIRWQGYLYDELLLEPMREENDAFELLNVTIGINFHWERKEDQRFVRTLKIIAGNGRLTGINVIHVGDYLTNVISSEMSTTTNPEPLKAHTVISRSWLSVQVHKNKVIIASQNLYPVLTQTGQELVKQYNREDHIHLNVCADDHYQRCQGITRASIEMVRRTTATTRGQVLMRKGSICDACFSKCCGGAFEEFQYYWEGIKHPYLPKQRDSKAGSGLSDLRVESGADQWIRTSPEAFCNTKDKKILSQISSNYGQETTDFYRWRIEYKQDELPELIPERSGIDYGQILDLIPVERGTSGRLIKLRIRGSKRTMTIGKELGIHRTLSTSYLYSSAFAIGKTGIVDNVPRRFILTGTGWGYRIGLCQIGVAVMDEQGHPYDTILLHYYIGATIDKLH